MYSILALLAFPFLAAADFVPTSPGPGDVAKQGGPCTMQWTPDVSGLWKQTYVELMTGSNSQMVHLTTVTVVDGTDPSKTSFSFTCPPVSLHAPVFFYQYTSPNTPNVTWTGRFTIADPSGATTPAPNDKQPDGENIPWGTARLAGVQGTPPPPTAPSGQIDGSSPSGNATIPSSGSSELPSSSESPLSGASLSTALPADSPSSSTSQSIVTAVVPASATSGGAAAPSGTTNGALRYPPSPVTAICFMFTLAALGLS